MATGHLARHTCRRRLQRHLNHGFLPSHRCPPTDLPSWPMHWVYRRLSQPVIVQRHSYHGRFQSRRALATIFDGRRHPHQRRPWFTITKPLDSSFMSFHPCTYLTTRTTHSLRLLPTLRATIRSLEGGRLCRCILPFKLN